MSYFRRMTLGFGLAAGLLVATSAEAGTVYLPLPGVTAVGTATYETRISVANNSTTQNPMKFLQLATGVNGTLRTGLTPTSLAVPVGATLILKPTANAPGLLEISSANTDFHYSARLVGLGALAGTGIELPVITSENLAPANGKLVVQGLRGGATQAADLALVNLGQAASECTISALRADGTAVFATATVSLLPLSHRQFTDIFGQVTAGVADARIVVTCTSDFYAYAQMRDTATGEFAIATPSGTSASTLSAPGENPAPNCNTGAVCFVFPGLVHTSTTSNPARYVTVNPPSAAYSSVRLHLEVQVGAFNGGGAHGLIWFVRNINRDMYANVFLLGPGTNTLTLRHGFDQRHGDKAKIVRGLTAQAGETYAIDYFYNPVAKTLKLDISNRGQVLVSIVDKPNVNKAHIEAGDDVIIGLSNPGTNPSIEPASIGWKYSNLKVEFVP